MADRWASVTSAQSVRLSSARIAARAGRDRSHMPFCASAVWLTALETPKAVTSAKQAKMTSDMAGVDLCRRFNADGLVDPCF